MRKIKFKSFLISFVAAFIVSILPHLGFKTPQVFEGLMLQNIFNTKSIQISPMSAKEDPMDKIYPKLTATLNDFKIKKDLRFIPGVKASGDYSKLKAYGVIDFESGEVIAEKNLSQSLPIASLTKIMTAVVALDLASPDEKFTVSYAASKQIPTKIGVVAGQKLTLEELLNATILTSANDAVDVIKEGIDQKYGAEVFIKAMNAKAQFLGLQKSSFENPQGFDGRNHLSSVEDLAVLSKYALTNYPLISQISKKQYHFLPENADHKQYDLYNWNGLLGVYPGAQGIKIGNTENAGKTTVVLAEREGKKILTVALGAPGVLERDLWAAQLLDLGFEEYGIIPADIKEEDLKAKYQTWKFWE